MKDIFEKDLSGEMVSPDEPGYEALINEIFDTMETSQELATVSVRDQKRVHELMEKITGKPLDESTTVLPPLYYRLRQARDHRQGMLHPAVLHVLRTRRHNHRRRCVHRTKMQSNNHQPRP